MSCIVTVETRSIYGVSIPIAAITFDPALVAAVGQIVGTQGL